MDLSRVSNPLHILLKAVKSKNGILFKCDKGVIDFSNYNFDQNKIFTKEFEVNQKEDDGKQPLKPIRKVWEELRPKI